MTRIRFWGFAAVVLISGGGLWQVQSQPAKPKFSTRMEPVAETKLLMEGIADPNARGLAQLLADKPRDAEAWVFARGQALLLAELGNLLLLRPPKTRAAEDAWMTYAAELRGHATTLARAAAAKDYLAARGALAELANTCNRCHQTFRVAIRINPFAEE
ncbi:MAG: cytochrome c [Gemmataceae bacterium]|nr:cytochrome c [Gemmata sp.]MDW8199087.1 cytochrome c [Gemmataceae bacterium]